MNEQFELQRKVALAEARHRGHLLTRFCDPVSDGSREIRTARCMECGQEVNISISNKLGRGRRWGDPLIFGCTPGEQKVGADLRLFEPGQPPIPEPEEPAIAFDPFRVLGSILVGI